MQLDDPSWATAWQPPFSADDARPLALVALSSTFQDQLAALARIRDALTSLPLRAILTLGPGLADRTLDSTKNVAVMRAAPHARILREAAVCISHCGHGTTLKALSAGVPLVCMPFGRDQGDNAARVVFHGAGVRLDRDATIDEIARAVTTVLGDARYRAAALRMADRLAAEAREDVCVRELEALVLTPSRAA
ncbi:MAG: hypothetical protein A2138_08115 [Deltaproteobacteria bacterium RBG_16_71_12]|nr:MAG: hypothetical protein A2138_08115 [Deltaproteobacteria bacterium RBG_16_71_12]